MANTHIQLLREHLVSEVLNNDVASKLTTAISVKCKMEPIVPAPEAGQRGIVDNLGRVDQVDRAEIDNLDRVETVVVD